jgi:NAD(P)-dependent dehydrogenase (short-subunit alcohol dehydrogenase family)
VLSQIAYRSSKTGLNMMMLEWQRYLKEDGVKVFCISPGFLATNLGGIGADKLKEMGAGDPSSGGALIKDVVEGKRDADAGKVVNAAGVQAW